MSQLATRQSNILWRLRSWLFWNLTSCVTAQCGLEEGGPVRLVRMQLEFWLQRPGRRGGPAVWQQRGRTVAVAGLGERETSSSGSRQHTCKPCSAGWGK